MAESSSNSLIQVSVDDFYFALLSNDGDEEEEEEEEVINDNAMCPISDEKYAQKLSFQEAILSSIQFSTNSHSHHQTITQLVGSSSSQASSSKVIDNDINREKMKAIVGESSQTICGICMEVKSSEDLFMNNIDNCSHTYCSECISRHIAAKIQENILMVTCPELNCKATLEPNICRAILPQRVFDRWEDALCESLVLRSNKIYCPYKECSAMILDDGNEVIREAECPHCRKLFCAQCKVPWHSEMGCDEFKRYGNDERSRADDLKLISLASKNKWRRCQNCSFYVEKKEGCLHITCRCGFQFCYGCGSRWTASHACNGI